MSRRRENVFLSGLLLAVIIPLTMLLGLAAPARADDAAAVAPPPDAAAVAPPDIAAKAAVMIDRNNGRVLYSKNPDEELAMASTTKMMTALLIIEDGHNLSDKVTCSKVCASIGESSIYLTEGETLTVEQMLNGMLIPSGNDAATALAEYDAGSVDAFVAKMNKRAQELGMTHTHFVTPHGLDEPGHYTSAADFAKLATEVMKHEQLREIVKRAEYNIPGYGSPTGRTLINTNHLLKYPYIDGIKTGYTDNAQECIVISAEQDGVSLIVVYLGGPTLDQRDQDVINLVQYGFSQYSDREVIKAGQQYASLDVPYSRGQKLALVASTGLSQHINMKDDVQDRLVLPDDLTLPIRKGDKVGMVEAFDGDTMIGSAYLTATEDVGAPSVSDKLSFDVSSVFHIFGIAGLWLAQVFPGGALMLTGRFPLT